MTSLKSMVMNMKNHNLKQFVYKVDNNLNESSFNVLGGTYIGLNTPYKLLLFVW